MIGAFLFEVIRINFLVFVLPVVLAISAFAIWRCVVPPRRTARYRTRGSLPFAITCWLLLVFMGSVYSFFKFNPYDFIVINTYRAAAPASAPFPKVESWANGGSTEAHQMLRLTGPASTGGGVASQAARPSARIGRAAALDIRCRVIISVVTVESTRRSA
jgi:hypothetical protein